MAHTNPTFGFSLNRSNGRMLAGAGIGAGLALLSVIGKRLLVQSPTLFAGNWDEALIAEHQAALKLFDKLAATRDPQKTKRTLLLAHLKNSLGRHALEEENVVYTAMRDADMQEEADKLITEHGYVKQYLYDLEMLVADNPAFQKKLAKFRADIEEHMREEETDLFPKLVRRLSDEENSTISTKMKKEGLKLA